MSSLSVVVREDASEVGPVAELSEAGQNLRLSLSLSLGGRDWIPNQRCGVSTFSPPQDLLLRDGLDSTQIPSRIILTIHI